MKDKTLDEKLIEQYKELHDKSPGYGNGTSHITRIVPWLDQIHAGTIIDYGCGKGRLSDRLEEKGYQVLRYDPAIPEFSSRPVIVADAVVCNDVLEHLTLESYRAVLKDIRSHATEGIFLSISCRPAKHVLPNGENCHTLVRGFDWWIAEIKTVINPKSYEALYETANKCLIIKLFL
jgi:hypothetical protein